MTPGWDAVVRGFHDAGRRTVFAVSGGGSLVLSDLLTVPGGSRSVLEAVVPYASEALTAWLGRPPEQACSETTARAMACVAYQRAVRLTHATRADAAPLGVACTASLASDRPKRGTHRCHIACQSSRETRTLSLVLAKGARSRLEEEQLVGRLILRALGLTCGLPVPPLEPELVAEEQLVLHDARPDPELAELWDGRRACLWSRPDGWSFQLPERPTAVVCGSFNPLHAGHEQLRAIGARRTGGPGVYELTVANADKPPLDFLSIDERRRQFTADPLALTSAGTFDQKAPLFPGAAFIVGVDTAARILETRFYDPATGVQGSLATIRRHGCRFLVAGRLVEGRFQSLADLTIPAGFADLFEAIPESEFRADVSSTELRARNGAG